MGNGIRKGLPVVPNPSLHRASRPGQFWLQRPSPPPGEGLHGTPGTSDASTLVRKGWLGGHLKIDLCSQLAEGTGSKVDGFRLARENEEAEPRMGKVRTGPTRIVTRMHIPREEAATLKELLGVGSRFGDSRRSRVQLGHTAAITSLATLL